MDFPLPPVGEGLIEVEIVRFLVAPGDAVTRGQPLLEVLSDKATMEVPAPFAGTVTELVGAPGDRVEVGAVVLRWGAPGEETPPPPPPPPSGEGGPEPKAATSTTPAAPSVRLLARKLGVDLAAVAGSGPGGRVLVEDLAAFVPAAAPPNPPAAPALDLGAAGTTLRLTGLRRKIAENMAASVRTIPHYSVMDECDFTDLVRLRGQLKEPFAAAGVKLTYLPFVLKAVARALARVPLANATYDPDTETLTQHRDVHLGVAVAAPAGLLVPVVRDAGRKSVKELARDVAALADAARRGTLGPDQFRGGTFTVSSVGNVGGLIATPIVYPPQVGVMALGRIARRPMFDDSGAICPAQIAYLSFSFDHRIVDGAVGATLLNAVKAELECPARLLAEV